MNLSRGARIGIAASVGFAVAFPVVIAVAFAHPPRRLHRRTPARLGLPYQRITLHTADNLKLSGWYIPHPDAKGIIVFCHGFTGNRSEMLSYLDFLHKAGYAGVLFDFRAHGWSEGRRVSFGHKETMDLDAAVEFVYATPELRDLPLAVFGESMGGAISLLVAGNEKRIAAVVADSPYARFDTAIDGRLRHILGNRIGGWVKPVAQFFGELLLHTKSANIAPIEAARRLDGRPLLLIQGTEDYLEPHRNSALIAEAAGENAVFWQIDGGKHVSSRWVPRDEYARRVVDFLDGALFPNW